MWHVICLAGPTDTFAPVIPTDDLSLLVPINVSDHEANVSSSVPDVLAQYGLAPPPGSRDLMNAAIAAYTADVRVPRGTAYDSWTRDIVLYLPVEEVRGWQDGGRVFESLLSFLTGDHWQIKVRPMPNGYVIPVGRAPKTAIPLTTNIVTLFSGGLDSFIGAVDLLEQGDQVALVGHHSLGGGPTSSSQTRALNALVHAYPPERAPFLKMWVSPPKGKKRGSEITTRGRSIIFLGLGIIVASSLHNGILFIPENGLISLNVPLTDARLGSFSTRTTHPHLIGLLRTLLRHLKISINIELPYRFATKGEMIRQCKNQGALQHGLSATMSCAHPSAGRFGPERNPNQHCGRCLPCLIRRAAVNSIMADSTSYAQDDLSQPLTVAKGADLRAVKMALDRYIMTPPRITDALLAGPLPGSDQELSEYLAVLRRGFEEIRRLLEH